MDPFISACGRQREMFYFPGMRQREICFFVSPAYIHVAGRGRLAYMHVAGRGRLAYMHVAGRGRLAWSFDVKYLEQVIKFLKKRLKHIHLHLSNLILKVKFQRSHISEQMHFFKLDKIHRWHEIFSCIWQASESVSISLNMECLSLGSL